MARLQSSLPTLAETRALMFLVDNGPSTVRDYFDKGKHIDGRAYTTIMSLMDILHSKGLATRVSEGKAYRYKASMSGDDIRRDAIDYVVENFYGGSLTDFQKAVAALTNRPKARPKRARRKAP
jgi:predicted transcriptional regulator